MRKHELSALKINRVEIEIKEYYPKSDKNDKQMDVSAILVTRLPPNVTDQQIELFLKNSKKIELGEVHSMEYDCNAKSAVVWFKDVKRKFINN